MTNIAHAKRYSQAVFEIALQKGELDGWQSDLNRIAGLSGDATITSFLENPKIPFDDKTKILAGQLGDINPRALNLVYLLVSRGAFSAAAEIANEYQRLLDNHNGIERAEVTTAVPLSDEDVQKMEERLSVIFDKKVVVTSRVDPDVLGGIVARIGGRLLDGSTRSRLENLKRTLNRAGR